MFETQKEKERKKGKRRILAKTIPLAINIDDLKYTVRFFLTSAACGFRLPMTENIHLYSHISIYRTLNDISHP